MTVRIYFSHNEFEDEAEFCIEFWNVRELTELFTGFCQENHSTEVTITEVCVVRCVETLDALTEMEENLCSKFVEVCATEPVAEADNKNESYYYQKEKIKRRTS